MRVLSSPCASEMLLFYEGARAAQPTDSSLQHLLHSLICMGQPLQVYAAPQRLIKPGQTHDEEMHSQVLMWQKGRRKKTNKKIVCLCSLINVEKHLGGTGSFSSRSMKAHSTKSNE